MIFFGRRKEVRRNRLDAATLVVVHGVRKYEMRKRGVGRENWSYFVGMYMPRVYRSGIPPEDALPPPPNPHPQPRLAHK